MDTPGFLLRQQFSSLIEALQRDGYRVIGPVLRDGAIVYTDIGSADELPAGVMLQTQPGRVHASETQLPRFFAWANGPQALKPLLFKPRQPLWQASRDERGQLAFSGPNRRWKPLPLSACVPAIWQRWHSRISTLFTPITATRITVGNASACC